MVAPAEAQRIADGLYWDKLADRVAALKAMPQWPSIDALLRRIRGIDEGIDGLVLRYAKLYERLARSRGASPVLEIGHGDLCFSNILYGRDSEVMKFIDARGASDENDLYTDRYYDIAKLSHSILGGYDFINNGLYSLDVDDNLHVRLDTVRRDRQGLTGLFRDAMQGAGYDVRLVRLYEASLFLSMLPLHIDFPRKVVAFAATAHRVLAEVEAASAGWKA